MIQGTYVRAVITTDEVQNTKYITLLVYKSQKDGVRHPQHTQTSYNSSTIAADNSTV